MLDPKTSRVGGPEDRSAFADRYAATLEALAAHRRDEYAALVTGSLDAGLSGRVALDLADSAIKEDALPFPSTAGG